MYLTTIFLILDLPKVYILNILDLGFTFADKEVECYSYVPFSEVNTAKFEMYREGI